MVPDREGASDVGYSPIWYSDSGLHWRWHRQRFVRVSSGGLRHAIVQSHTAPNTFVIQVWLSSPADDYPTLRRQVSERIWRDSQWRESALYRSKQWTPWTSATSCHMGGAHGSAACWWIDGQSQHGGTKDFPGIPIQPRSLDVLQA